MKAQAKTLIFLVCLGVFSYVLDAVTSAWGLSHGYAESDKVFASSYLTVGVPLTFIYASVSWVIATAVLTVTYCWVSKYTKETFTAKMFSGFLWLIVASIAVLSCFLAYPHLVFTGIPNAQKIFSLGAYPK